VRFQVLSEASMKFRFVFWEVLPCKIIFDRRFRGTFCLHHQGDEKTNLNFIVYTYLFFALSIVCFFKFKNLKTLHYYVLKDGSSFIFRSRRSMKSKTKTVKIKWLIMPLPLYFQALKRIDLCWQGLGPEFCDGTWTCRSKSRPRWPGG
jgi:hypothetical protein